MKYIFTVAFLIFILPSSSFAEVENENYFFKTMGNVKKLLRVNGVDPTSVSWVEIDAMCSPLKRISDIEENKCFYQKARDESDFKANRKFCEKLALSSFDDFLNKEKKLTFYKKVGADEKKEQIFYGSRFSDDEIEAGRSRTFLNCMAQFGWKDFEDWKKGKIK